MTIQTGFLTTLISVPIVLAGVVFILMGRHWRGLSPREKGRAAAAACGAQGLGSVVILALRFGVNLTTLVASLGFAALCVLGYWVFKVDAENKQVVAEDAVPNGKGDVKGSAN